MSPYQGQIAGNYFFLALTNVAQTIEKHAGICRFALKIAIPGAECVFGAENPPAPSVEDFKRNKIAHGERVADAEHIVSPRRPTGREGIGNKNLVAVQRTGVNRVDENSVGRLAVFMHNCDGVGGRRCWRDDGIGKSGGGYASGRAPQKLLGALGRNIDLKRVAEVNQRVFVQDFIGLKIVKIDFVHVQGFAVKANFVNFAFEGFVERANGFAYFEKSRIVEVEAGGRDGFVAQHAIDIERVARVAARQRDVLPAWPFVQGVGYDGQQRIIFSNARRDGARVGRIAHPKGVIGVAGFLLGHHELRRPLHLLFLRADVKTDRKVARRKNIIKRPYDVNIVVHAVEVERRIAHTAIALDAAAKRGTGAIATVVEATTVIEGEIGLEFDILSSQCAANQEKRQESERKKSHPNRNFLGQINAGRLNKVLADGGLE